MNELGRRHVIHSVAATTIPQAQAAWCAMPRRRRPARKAASCLYKLLLVFLPRRKGTNTGQGRRSTILFSIQIHERKGMMNGRIGISNEVENRPPSFHESDGERRRGRRGALVSRGLSMASALPFSASRHLLHAPTTCQCLRCAGVAETQRREKESLFLCAHVSVCIEWRAQDFKYGYSKGRKI